MKNMIYSAIYNNIDDAIKSKDIEKLKKIRDLCYKGLDLSLSEQNIEMADSIENMMRRIEICIDTSMKKFY